MYYIPTCSFSARVVFIYCLFLFWISILIFLSDNLMLKCIEWVWKLFYRLYFPVYYFHTWWFDKIWIYIYKRNKYLIMRYSIRKLSVFTVQAIHSTKRGQSIEWPVNYCTLIRIYITIIHIAEYAPLIFFPMTMLQSLFV